MRFHEIINKNRLLEASDAPLYHATSFTNAESILKDGGIRCWGRERNEAHICASRDARLLFKSSRVQFVLDTRKIKQRFRVQPFDFNAGGFANSRSESEERIMTNFLPLDCISAMMLLPSTMKPGIAAVEHRTGDQIAALAASKGLKVIDKRPVLAEDQRFDVTQTPQFQAWFKGSKVVDKSGKPQVCYHGTFEDFAEFSHNPVGRVSSGFNRLGFWFDTDPRTPSYFAGYDGYSGPSNGNVMPVYLNIKKPLLMDSEFLWDEDREKIAAMSAELKKWSAIHDYRRSDKYGNPVDREGNPLLDPYGKRFNEDTYLKLQKERAAFMNKLQHERSDGWWRLMHMLPNGVKSKDREVDEFKAEIMAEGYDGIFLGDTIADFGTRNYDTTHWWLAFHPNQIKSVFAKSFNPDSANISEDNNDA